MGEDDAAGASEQVSDWIACTAGSGPVLVLHVIWFGTWVTVNTRGLHGIQPLDPFPFPFLTMTVSLVTIFLALSFSSQDPLSHQADKCSHLDLQIDLLAEREMTAVLQLLQDITSASSSGNGHSAADSRPLQQARETARLRLHRSSPRELTSCATVSMNGAVARRT
jgi:uncharacterized membrane protein